MEERQSWKEAVGYLRSIDSAMKDKAGLAGQFWKTLRLKISKYHLGVIIYLHTKNYLLTLLTRVKELSNKDQSFFNIYNLILKYSYKCLLCYDKNYQSFKELKNKEGQGHFQSSLNQKEKENFLNLETAIKKFMLIRHNEVMQSFEKGKKINQYAHQELSKLYSLTVYDEIAITWLKKEVETDKLIIFKQKNCINVVGLCCQLHFENNKNPIPIQYPGHFYLNTQGQLSSNDLDNIKKTIVFYLNNQGGYLFLGIENKSKLGTVHGIQLSSVQRLQLLKKFMEDIIANILPFDSENEDEEQEKQEETRKKMINQKSVLFQKEVEKKLQHQLSSYATLEFLNLYNKDTLLYHREGKQEVQLYVIRIKIRIGDPAEVYFIVNQKGVPEAYTQNTQKPLSMIQYVNQVYKHLKDQANNKPQRKQPLSHPLCLQDLKRIQKQLKSTNL